jgi:hypothetical protein
MRGVKKKPAVYECGLLIARWWREFPQDLFTSYPCTVVEVEGVSSFDVISVA